MLVSDGMSEVVLTVGPGHTLREAAAAMCDRGVGAAVVIDPEAQGPGVITERDILRSVAGGENPDEQRVADHLTAKLTFAHPDWSLEQAAAAMVRGGFRHLVIVDGSELAGVLSMRDIVRVWAGDGATSEVPSSSARGS
jgi:CBS domain-containing protein